MEKWEGTMESMGIEDKNTDIFFWKGKKVFVTGHTGFKGTWLSEILSYFGAEVSGYALDSDNSAFDILNTDERIKSNIGDIRDYNALYSVMSKFKPEIVFHLAAQPIVKESYKNPLYTYETNVMGTVNVLECIRNICSVKSVVNVTTDKVYDNREWCWGYRETDSLDGFDPYSNSKSCSELVTHSYIRSFFENRDISVSTARAGNVIGGGDFSSDRIIPDCVRAAVKGKEITIRNPDSVRPYQHVLEPLFAYMMIAEKQFGCKEYSGNYNIGPEMDNCVTTGEIADIFCDLWENVSWINVSEKNAPHEANFLKLDCSKIKSVFGWNSKWDIVESVKKTVEWYKAFYAGEEMLDKTIEQIKEYIG